MGIIHLEGEYSIDQAIELADKFLEDESQRIFFLIGRTGIGKDYTLRELFNKKQLEYIDLNHYPNLEERIETHLAGNPTSLYLWRDVDLSVFQDKKVSDKLSQIDNNETPFEGKLIISATSNESDKSESFNLPRGTWVHMDNTATINYIERTLVGKSPD
ncbi:MAG: hypothetical protein GX842_07050 [Spirochaetales bacterium]|nr:hypothetical protein [Spirochaetales bacterium]